MAAKGMEKWLEAFNADEKNTQQPFFIHKTLRYSYKDEERQQGVKKTLKQSVSGLVFLQGTVNDLQEFLADHFPKFHLVNDRSLGRPVSIKDSIMQPFMNVMKTHPEQVTFLRDDFEKFAKDHVKLRVLSGPFKDYEGYIVRIDRDRQLVFDFGGLAVAIRGVHKEDFKVVEE
jgi:transcription antitermination factor NusG